MIRKFCVHIYCGDGKGKTSAALGLAVRAAGRGMKVLISRFMKNDNSGELTSLNQISGIDVMPCDEYFGFYSKMTETLKEAARVYYTNQFNKVLEISKNYDVIIFDEIIWAYNYNFIDRKSLMDFINKRCAESVLTGRNPAKDLIDCADYVSEIKKIKHPFDEGINARKGIEF